MIPEPTPELTRRLGWIAEFMEDHGIGMGDECDAPTLRQAAEELSRLQSQHDKLQAFKSWTHQYLDRQGVPPYPPGVHGAEGCRIGDRMDWLMERLHTAEAEQRRLTDILEAPQIALFADGREPTENERHLLNLLSWRQQEAVDARAERDACHALFGEVITLCGHDPAGGRPGLVDAVRQVVCDRDEAIRVACERVGADPAVQRVLIDELGTDNPDMIAVGLRLRRAHHEKARRLLQSVRTVLWDACCPPWPDLNTLAARVHAFLGE